MRVDDEGPGADDGDAGTTPAGAPPQRERDWGGDPPAVSAFLPYASPGARRVSARNAVIAASTGSALAGAACAWGWFVLRDAADGVRGGRGADVDDLRLPGGDAAVADRVQDVQNLVSAMSVVALLTLLVSAYYVLRWQSDALRQQEPLGIDRPRFSPTKAGWSWFVPVWSLFGPKQAFNDLWRATEPGAPARVTDGSWRDRRPDRLLAAWWAAWLVGSTLGNATTGEGLGGDTIGGAMDTLLITGFGSASTVLAGVLFVRIIDRLVARADRRAAELGLPGAPPRGAAGPSGLGLPG